MKLRRGGRGRRPPFLTSGEWSSVSYSVLEKPKGIVPRVAPEMLALARDDSGFYACFCQCF